MAHSVHDPCLRIQLLCLLIIHIRLTSFVKEEVGLEKNGACFNHNP